MAFLSMIMTIFNVNFVHSFYIISQADGFFWFLYLKNLQLFCAFKQELSCCHLGVQKTKIMAPGLPCPEVWY